MNIESHEAEPAAITPTGLGRLGGRAGFHPRPARSGLAALIALWYRRWEQRTALAALDDHRLRDICKTRTEALDEAAKPFWRP